MTRSRPPTWLGASLRRATAAVAGGIAAVSCATAELADVPAMRMNQGIGMLRSCGLSGLLP
jgi:hypothetical protein